MSQPPHIDPAGANARLAELEAVTHDYARYADSAGGLSAVAGGLLCLLSYGIGGTLAPTTPVRIGLLAIPLVWLVLKQFVARRFYQRLGRVDELHDATRTRAQRWLLGGVAAIVVLIVLGTLVGVDSPALGRGSAETALYFVIVAALPVIAWRWLRTPIDLAVGAFLLCQAALGAVGTGYALLSGALVFLPAAFLMIASGVRDHRHFRKLQQRIRELASAQQAEL